MDLPEGSVQVLVVDRHPLTRIGLAVLLHRQRWVARCLLSADRDEAVALIERHRPDVAIVDVSGDGARVSSQLGPLLAARPSMPIVVAGYYWQADQVAVLAGSGRGLLTADMTTDEVLQVVRAALVGEQPPLRASRTHTRALSAREREVLALLCTGATNREIAALMNVGTDTVKKHAAALYRKLGVRNRTEAAQRARALLAA